MNNQFIKKIKDFVKKHEYLFLFFVASIFVLIRLPGTTLPLHQDEYKWPQIVNPSVNSDTEIPHPPLSQFIYRIGGSIVGFNTNFRFIPLFFGVLNLLLLYLYVKNKWGIKTAVLSVFVFSVSYFSILASLMVDTDGEILPFFFLIALISYEKLKSVELRKRLSWFFLLFFSVISGLFVKVSFVLPVFAILADFIFERRYFLGKKKLIKFILYFVGFVSFFILLLVMSQKVFPFFSLDKSLLYWEHFWGTKRGWFQTFIQLFKVILYTSPVLILIPTYIPRQKIRELIPHISYLLFGFIFYILLFDFSIGALDRYLQFIIIPLSIIFSVVFWNVWNGDFYVKRKKEFILFSFLVAFFLIFVTYINHYVPSLHPKMDWIKRILYFKWNFVYPFSGGSGPLGFYVSFLFMGLSWFISIILFIIGYFRRELRLYVIVFLVPISLVYNIVFAEEYLFGKINGSAPKLLFNVVEFIKNNPDIEYVTVYNDNGGDEIKSIGKYRKRLYTDPKFNIKEKIDTLNQYKEHYLEIDIPKIDPNSIYRKYLDSCNMVYKEVDKKISATIYDCRNIEDISI